MKLIFNKLAFYKKEAIMSPLFKLFESLLDLLVPIILSYIIDVGIANGDKNFIVTRFLMLIGMAILGIVLSLIAQYFAAKAATCSSSLIKRDLYHKIQTLSYSDLDELGYSSLLTKMTDDVNSIRTGINLGLRLLLRSPFIVFGALICAFLIDVTSGIIFTIIILILFAIVFSITLTTLNRYIKIQNNTDFILTKTRETLSGSRVIKANVKEDSEYKEFVRINNILSKLQIATTKISTLLNPLTFVIINIAIVALLYSGNITVSQGALTTGQIVALYNYLTQILVELIKLSNLVITESKALASSKRIQAVLDIQTEPVANGNIKPNDYDIEINNVQMQYKINSEPTLFDISLKIPYGEKLGIIGGTGSGKSTLSEIIAGFYDVSSGEVKIGDTNIHDIDSKYLNEEIVSYVPQHPQLFSGTIRENLSMSKNIDDQVLNNSLKDAQIYDQLAGKGGLDYILNEGGNNLSGGQRQRLTIARSLAQNSRVLILDDSFSALDYTTEKNIRTTLLNKENTVIIISQRISSIMYCDNIVVLDNGRIVGYGKHNDLVRNCELYKEIYDTQFKEEK